jgi:hypothetical protein
MKLINLDESLEEATGIKKAALERLKAEARKYPTFEEFSHAFSIQIKRGTYWHFTTNPKFKIDVKRGPRDMSSGAAGFSQSTGKLMVTSDFDNWAAYYGKARPFVALIDLSKVPSNSYRQVSRGFGNEFIVDAPSKAKVLKVYPVASGKRTDSTVDRAIFSDIHGKDDLKRFYNEVHGIEESLEEGSDCPIRSKWFGGIPGGGGYQVNTEYEVGAQRMAEAVHCILGSLGKFFKTWPSTLATEHEHIQEEMGLIEKFMKEYSRDLYSDRVRTGSGMFGEKPKEDFSQKTVDSINQNSPKLRANAEKMKKRWMAQDDVPKEVMEVGKWCYIVLIDMTKALEESVKRYPKEVTNAFQETELKASVRLLRDKIEKMYKVFPTRWTPDLTKESTVRTDSVLTEAKELMWHGTAAKFMREILKKGFVPDPKKKVWGAGRLESFSGTYFTLNFMTASSSAQSAAQKFGGNRLYVGAQIETRASEVVVDEDQLLSPPRIISWGQKVVDPEDATYVGMDMWAGHYKLDYDKMYDAFIDWYTKKYKHIPKQRWLNTRKEFDNYIKTWLAYNVSRFARSEDAEKFGEVTRYPGWTLINRFGTTGYPKQPEFKKARTAYRKATDTLLRKMKDLSVSPEDAFMHNVRVTTPVTFRGANKILLVVEAEEPTFKERDSGEKPYYGIYTVHYVKDPNALKKLIASVQKDKGPHFKVQYAKGTRGPSYDSPDPDKVKR